MHLLKWFVSEIVLTLLNYQLIKDTESEFWLLLYYVCIHRLERLILFNTIQCTSIMFSI